MIHWLTQVSSWFYLVWGERSNPYVKEAEKGISVNKNLEWRLCGQENFLDGQVDTVRLLTNSK